MRLITGLLPGCMLLIAPCASALAQEATTPQPGAKPVVTRALDQAPAVLSAPSTNTLPAPVTANPETDMATEFAQFAQFDALQPQGSTTNFPGTYDTLTGNVGGWRTWLLDHDLYFRFISVNPFADNLLSESTARNPQQYNGQRTTAANNAFLQFSWKIAGSGKDITQLNVEFEHNAVTWNSLGPAGSDFLELDLYSSFFNRRVEVTAGFTGNDFNFVGLFAGGNPILASGLGGTIPIETGLSASTADAPTVNVQLNADDGYYSKTGIQRSISPQGLVYDAHRNGVNLAFTEPGTSPLYIEELGVLRPASADERQIWIRGGGLYNSTEYSNLDGVGKNRNWSAYLLGDYQIYKPSTATPYRGIFLGASVIVAPPDVNVYTQTYELRGYAIGMVPGRPSDSITLTVDDNVFSNKGDAVFSGLGDTTQRNQLSASLLYAWHVTRGLYLAPSLTLLHHPAFLSADQNAFNAGVTLTIQL